MKHKYLGVCLIAASLTLPFVFPLTAIAAKKKSAATRPPNTAHKTTLISANKGYSLGFVRGGALNTISVQVGDTVHRGDVLAIQDSSETLAKLHQAVASLTYQQLKLVELTITASSSGASVADTIKLQNAFAGLDDARRSGLGVIIDSYMKSDDAVHNRADQFFQNSKTSSPSLVLTGVDASVQVAISPQRTSVENALIAWKAYIDSLSSSSDMVAGMAVSTTYLNQVKDFLNTLGTAVNNISSDANISQYNLHLWKGDLYTGRLNVNSAIKDVVAARAKLRDAQLQVDLLNTSQASSTLQTKIAEQNAQIQQAQAEVELAQAQLKQTTLVAPRDGKVTKVLYGPGSVVSAGAPIMYVVWQ